MSQMSPVHVFDWLPVFPVTRDQLTMLAEGNTADPSIICSNLQTSAPQPANIRAGPDYLQIEIARTRRFRRQSGNPPEQTDSSSCVNVRSYVDCGSSLPQGYKRGIHKVSAIPTATETTAPTMKRVQELGRSAPRATINVSTGRSR